MYALLPATVEVPPTRGPALSTAAEDVLQRGVGQWTGAEREVGERDSHALVGHIDDPFLFCSTLAPIDTGDSCHC